MRVKGQVFMMTGYSSIEFPLFGYQWVQASDLAASLLS